MLRDALVLLATGKDRPGIVDRLTGLIYEAGCNLEDSRMAALGGEFALIVLFTGKPDSLSRVRDQLPALARDVGLTLELKETVAGPEARREAAGCVPYRIAAVALDHPGIVHRVTRLLAENRVNVARLDASLVNAPVTGAPVFSLEIEAEVPADVSVSALRGQLERLAAAENIDLEMRALR